MSKIEERGRRENAAQGEKDKSQSGTYGEMEQAGKTRAGQKQRQDTGDSETEMEQARKAAP